MGQNLNPNEQFAEGDASKIDKAVASSPVAVHVGGAQLLKTLTGNVDLVSPIGLEQLYKRYGKSIENLDAVPGFVYRGEKKPIKLRLPGRNSKNQLVVGATFEDAVHEVIHLNSKPYAELTYFENFFSHSYNEGVTEYFTELVLGASGQAYRDELAFAQGLMSALGSDGEKTVAEAYFKGEPKLYLRIQQAFGTANSSHNFRDWQTRARSANHEDWKVARQLVATALARTAAAAPPAPPVPAAGSGSGGGAGAGSGMPGSGSSPP